MNADVVQQLVAIGGSVVTTLLAAWVKDHFEGKRRRRRRLRSRRPQTLETATPDRDPSE